MLVVNTPATTDTLVTLAKAKEYLGITDAASDTKLEDTLARVTAAVEAYCGRVLRLEVVTETLRLNADPYAGGLVDEIFLERYPLVTITSVSEDGVVLDTTDYEVDKAAGSLLRLSSDEPCSWTPCKVVVGYSGGYAAGSEDPALVRAVLAIVKLDWLSMGRDPTLKAVDLPGVGRHEFWIGGERGLNGLPPEIEGMLTPFKRIGA